MIEVGIDPVAFSIGSISVRWYSIMTAAAAVTVVTWAVYAARKAKISSDLVYTLAIWGVIGGLLGARLVHIIDELNFYIQNPGQLFGFGGLAIYGAILGVTLSLWIASKVHKFQFGPMADMVAPGALLGMAVGRIGCVINGCCYGAPTTLPWGLVYTHPNSFAPLGVSTQPAVVYEMLFDIGLFVVVWKLRGKLRPAGSLFLVYLAAYSVGRFFLAMFRDPSSQGPIFLGWFMQAQIIAVLVLLVTVPLLITRTRWVKAGDVTSEDGVQPKDGAGGVS
ncbi:MAG: prolipoprotein diacylglyceryl transferase [Dehalococcoidia bacterium]|nr:prolipoprotein diacylglyceryl transferase [Dehalococcoidia bacterium]